MRHERGETIPLSRLWALALLLSTSGCIGTGADTGQCTSWRISIDLLGASVSQSASSLTGDLEIAGRQSSFACPKNCEPIAGGVSIKWATFMGFDLENTDFVRLSARAADETALLTDEMIPIGDYRAQGQHDSYQVDCSKTGRLSF